jgi:Tol biopolymer transport system component
VNADGSGLARLSPIPGADTLPAFSSDGTKIVFSYVVSQNSCNGGSFPTTNIMTMSALDGSARTTIVDGSSASTCFNVEPRFAPDGSAIAFMCGPANSNVQACAVAPDGSGWRYLTNVTTTVGDPHWSWDSRKLAISHRDTAGNVNVWTLNADGTGLSQVTAFAEPQEAGDVGWSLDDARLVFEHDTGGQGQSVAGAPAGIYIVGVDGSQVMSLNVPCSDSGCAPRFRPKP